MTASPDDIATPASARSEPNALLNEFPALSADHFVCREPPYLCTLRRGGLLLLASGLTYSALSGPRLPWPLVTLLSIVAALAMVVAIRLGTATIHFASDSRGMFFPSRRRFALAGRATAQSWLFVPWSNISGVCVQLLLDESGSKGVSFSLCASEEERRAYFPGSPEPDRAARLPAGPRSWVRVGYPSAPGAPRKIVAQLRRLQGRPPMQAAAKSAR